MKTLLDYLGCGNIYTALESVELKCTSFKDISEKIIPFFIKYPIIGVKSLDFEDWCKIAFIMNTKEAFLTPEGYKKIILIKSGMNKERYMKSN